ncbi:unnamed protein product [Cochlearia groenlandica]
MLVSKCIKKLMKEFLPGSNLVKEAVDLFEAAIAGVESVEEKRLCVPNEAMLSRITTELRRKGMKEEADKLVANLDNTAMASLVKA